MSGWRETEKERKKFFVSPPSPPWPPPGQAPCRVQGEEEGKHFTGGSFQARIQQTDRLINKTKKWERRNTPPPTSSSFSSSLSSSSPAPAPSSLWDGLVGKVTQEWHHVLSGKRKKREREGERERSVSATAMRLTRREKTWSTGSLRIDQKLRQENWKKKGEGVRGEGQSGRTQQGT